MAAYTDFLDGVQTKATQLAGISIFQNDKTGYDLKNIEATAKVYAGLTATEIDYYPQKGLYTAISYAFTDLILLASMLLLALILVRQEMCIRDSPYYSVLGCGGESGYYETRARDDGSANVTYIDYSSQKEIYLCNAPAVSYTHLMPVCGKPPTTQWKAFWYASTQLPEPAKRCFPWTAHGSKAL